MVGKQRHTPGPWKHENGEIVSEATGDVVISDEWHGFMEAFVNKGHKEADAQLIATAPELFEMVQETYTWLHDGVGHEHDPEGRISIDRIDYYDMLDKMEELIDKAAGAPEDD